MNNGIETFRFYEFDIPVPLLNMTGGGTDTFDIISQGHIDNLRKFIGIEPDESYWMRHRPGRHPADKNSVRERKILGD